MSEPTFYERPPPSAIEARRRATDFIQRMRSSVDEQIVDLRAQLILLGFVADRVGRPAVLRLNGHTYH